jgi:hypothetical protein
MNYLVMPFNIVGVPIDFEELETWIIPVLLTVFGFLNCITLLSLIWFISIIKKQVSTKDVNSWRIFLAGVRYSSSQEIDLCQLC